MHSGTGARYFVLQSSEKQVKLECGHAGTVTIALHTPEDGEPDEVHLMLEDGERCAVMEVALQVLLRDRHRSTTKALQARQVGLLDEVVDLLEPALPLSPAGFLAQGPAVAVVTAGPAVF